MKSMMRFFLTVLFVPIFAVAVFSQAKNVPSPTMLFMSVAPDARAASMGDAGVATPADANAIYWNPGKLAASDKDLGFSVSYSPWLRNIVNDMAMYNIMGYKKSGDNQAFGFGINYFDQGAFQASDNSGNSLGNFNSKEYAITGSYSRKLSQVLSLGVNLKYLNSNLAGNFSGSITNTKPAQTVAADIGLFWNKVSDKNWNTSYGLSLSNISGKVSYGGQDKNFIPTNLRLGLASSKDVSDNGRFTFTVDLNKLMVPTPKDGTNLQDVTAIGGIFSSLFDAPGGFGEELKEFTVSLGAEYLINNVFALRTGFFNESKDKGGRKYLTAGVGFKIDQKYALDFAYLVPTESNSPVANTLRISLLAAINNGSGSKK